MKEAGWVGSVIKRSISWEKEKEQKRHKFQHREDTPDTFGWPYGCDLQRKGV